MNMFSSKKAIIKENEELKCDIVDLQSEIKRLRIKLSDEETSKHNIYELNKKYGKIVSEINNTLLEYHDITPSIYNTRLIKKIQSIIKEQ